MWTRGTVEEPHTTLQVVTPTRRVEVSGVKWSQRVCVVKEDSFGFEIVDATLSKVMKSSNTAPNTVALKDEEIGPVSNSSKLAGWFIE
ncbi:hypothetical protein L1987_61190 [Smallanthus sonchifolius]|uniref:Uncharacterized protein n=1 Tax=Smallanthus sonchifolius TaxID=185202 RepID=A0ACB9DAI0_9ASTR|nr:hypothetical protein L1987_61190 [Smallanthus sonchifolius]